MPRKIDWEMSQDMSDRIHRICKDRKDLVRWLPPGLIYKAIQTSLKEDGGDVMPQTYDEVQQEINLLPGELKALKQGCTVIITRDNAFPDREDVTTQSVEVIKKK